MCMYAFLGGPAIVFQYNHVCSLDFLLLWCQCSCVGSLLFCWTGLSTGWAECVSCQAQNSQQNPFEVEDSPIPLLTIPLCILAIRWWSDPVSTDLQRITSWAPRFNIQNVLVPELWHAWYNIAQSISVSLCSRLGSCNASRQPQPYLPCGKATEASFGPEVEES
jgi:hypothetical protein